MKKVIVLTRYFTNGAELDVHYSAHFEYATLRFRADKLGKRNWLINIKCEISYEFAEEIIKMYSFCDEVDINLFICLVKAHLKSEEINDD